MMCSGRWFSKEEQLKNIQARGLLLCNTYLKKKRKNWREICKGINMNRNIVTEYALATKGVDLVRGGGGGGDGGNNGDSDGMNVFGTLSSI